MITEKFADLSYKDLMNKVVFNAHKKNLYGLLSNGAASGLKGLQIGGITGAGIGGIKGLYDTYSSDSPDKSFSDYAKGGLAGAAKWGLGGSLIGGGIGAGVGIIPNIPEAFNNYKTINTLKDKSNELVDRYIKYKEDDIIGRSKFIREATEKFIHNDPLLSGDAGAFNYLYENVFKPMTPDAYKNYHHNVKDYYDSVFPLHGENEKTRHSLFILNFLDRLKNNKLNSDFFNRGMNVEKVREVLLKVSPDKINLDKFPWSGDYDPSVLDYVLDSEKIKNTLISDLINRAKKSTNLQDVYRIYRDPDLNFFGSRAPFGTKVILPGNQYYKQG